MNVAGVAWAWAWAWPVPQKNRDRERKRRGNVAGLEDLRRPDPKPHAKRVGILLDYFVHSHVASVPSFSHRHKSIADYQAVDSSGGKKKTHRHEYNEAQIALGHLSYGV